MQNFGCFFIPHGKVVAATDLRRRNFEHKGFFHRRWSSLDWSLGTGSVPRPDPNGPDLGTTGTR